MEPCDNILFNKDGFKFVCIKKNNYNLTFGMTNHNIMLPKIVDFSLIKLIYDLNPDVYENVQIEQLNEHEAFSTMLMKHLFEDLGLPQRYSFAHITKTVNEKQLTFVTQSINTHRPKGIPEDAELMAIENMEIICDVVSPHVLNFNINIKFDQSMNVPSFVEKIIGVILNKVFKRVKQFIENVAV